MNIEHRTLNVEHRIMYSACRELLCRTVYLKKDWASLLRRKGYEGQERIYPSKLVSLRLILRFACFKIDKA